jgi:hypothetical protein
VEVSQALRANMQREARLSYKFEVGWWFPFAEGMYARKADGFVAAGRKQQLGVLCAGVVWHRTAHKAPVCTCGSDGLAHRRG